MRIWWHSFLTEICEQALSIGKSIQFIRRTCQDQEWWVKKKYYFSINNLEIFVCISPLTLLRILCIFFFRLLDVEDIHQEINKNDTETKETKKKTFQHSFEYGRNDRLMKMMNICERKTNLRLCSLLFDKYDLILHLSAIKRYVFTHISHISPTYSQ